MKTENENANQTHLINLYHIQGTVRRRVKAVLVSPSPTLVIRQNSSTLILVIFGMSSGMSL